MPETLIIGWREKVDLPDWGIRGIEAKADTGARSSAVDVKNLKRIDDDHVRFEVVLSRSDRTKTVPVVAAVKRHTTIKSSNGHISERVVVTTTMQLGGIEKPIDISLICRKRMQCRMLIGRTALATDFLVQSSQIYLVSEKTTRLKKRKTKKSPRPSKLRSKPTE